LHPEAVALGELTEGLVEMLRRSVGPTIEIAVDVAPDVDPIRVDPNQLELALLNLTLNARDAMPDGGKVTISARNAETGSNAIVLQGGNYVQLAVTDNGTGMDEITLKRCTEPFFTTKDRGKGTGLGLSSVHGMAVQSGGAVHISSAPGTGTTVNLWFPVATERATRRDAASPIDLGLAAERLMVLVVDDEALVGHVTAAMIEDLGHAALWVSSGAEALEILRSDRGVDLMITDHAMPGMTGAVLAETVHKLKPDLPIILATGFADIPGSYAQTLPRLAKPYGPTELSTAIDAIGRHRQASYA
jgi:CheY-like chemotaxis protein/two-component sensor histidine kinase